MVVVSFFEVGYYFWIGVMYELVVDLEVYDYYDGLVFDWVWVILVFVYCVFVVEVIRFGSF